MNRQKLTRNFNDINIWEENKTKSGKYIWLEGHRGQGMLIG